MTKRHRGDEKTADPVTRTLAEKHDQADYLQGKTPANFEPRLLAKKARENPGGETALGQIALGVLLKDAWTRHTKGLNDPKGRSEGAKTNRDRADKWRKEARDMARSIWSGKTPGRYWTLDEMARDLHPRLQASHKLKTLSVKTVKDAIKGVKQELRQGR